MVTDKGYLKIFVYTARQIFPVPGATVYIKKEENLLNTLLTNSSGQTEELEFETPPLSNSTSPNEPQGYTALDVRIEKDGFLPAYITNVQIFPGIVSRLETELVPLPDNPEFKDKESDFNVPAQNLN